ncbi:MAG: hypothetical protein HY672_02050 [Chloroflexi bacterium]|nr:hypothetical protein [Chloroflexota bacterium]
MREKHMEREYTVVVRGVIPADLSEKVNRLHAEAIRHKKSEGEGTAVAAAGAGSPAALNKVNGTRSSVLGRGAESRASPKETAAEGGCS